MLLEATHLADVLLAVQRVDDRARTEEQAGLEERVGHQVEDAGAERAHAHGQEHVTQLRHGRIRQHALDVVLHQADGAGHQRRRGTDHRDNRQGDRRVLEQHRVTADHVNAGGHHGGGVDEGRHRGRAFHRVGQPYVERNLRRLARRADEQQQGNQRQRAERHLDRHLLRGQGDGREVKRIERHHQHQGAQDEREVTDAVDDERLLGRVRCRLLLVVEANQQVRAQAHAFPADEHHQDVRAEHQHQHEEAEQVQVREEPGEVGVGFLVHVRGRIDVNQ